MMGTTADSGENGYLCHADVLDSASSGAHTSSLEKTDRIQRSVISVGKSNDIGYFLGNDPSQPLKPHRRLKWVRVLTEIGKADLFLRVMVPYWTSARVQVEIACLPPGRALLSGGYLSMRLAWLSLL